MWQAGGAAECGHVALRVVWASGGSYHPATAPSHPGPTTAGFGPAMIRP